MSFRICIKFFTNLAQAQFCSYSRLDLTSNGRMFHLFQIWGTALFEAFLSWHADMSACFLAAFLVLLILFITPPKWYRCKCSSFMQNVLCNAVKKHWAIQFSVQEKNRSFSRATFILLSQQFALWFCAVTLRACDAGMKDPILDIKTIFDHISCFQNQQIGASWGWTYTFFEDGNLES